MHIERFDIKSSICERCPRKPSSGIKVPDDDDENDEAQEISRMNVNTAQNFIQNKSTFACFEGIKLI